jgi:hypothetical protein
MAEGDQHPRFLGETLDGRLSFLVPGELLDQLLHGHRAVE